MKEIRNFRFLEYKDGLPEIDVKETIIDDQNGYWFRTSENVVYFNGHEFISYNKNNTIFHLSNSRINDIQIQKDRIYVFGDMGVDEIDCISKKSKAYYIDSNKLNLLGGIFTTKGKMLAISQSGAIFNIEKAKLIPLGHMDVYSSLNFHETPAGQILISNANKTVIVFSSTLRQIRKIQFDSQWVLSGGIHEYGGLGTILVVYNKAYLYSPQTTSFTLINLPFSFGRLFYHKNKMNYVVSHFENINQFDASTQKNTILKLNTNNNIFINQLIIDKNKTIVLSTNQGLILFKEPVDFVSNIDADMNKNGLKATTRRAILETEDGKILQLVYKQTNLYDPKLGLNRVIATNKLDSYSGLIEGPDLWIGIDGGGLAKMNLKTFEITKTVSYDNYLKGIFSSITAIVRYNNTKLLVSEAYASASSLNLYDVEKNFFTPLLIKGLKSRYLTKKISTIVPANKSRKWICSDEGLYLINQNDSLIFYLGRKEIGTDSVNYVYEDGRQLWIATNNGLVKYDTQIKRQVQFFNLNSGLSGNRCIAIIPDQFSTLWIPTYTGLSRIQISSSKIINYHISDGLVDEEYNYSSYLRSKSGDIYLGGLNGYIRIVPEQFDQNLSTDVELKLDYVLKQRKDNTSIFEFLGNKNIKFHQSKESLEISFSVRKPISSEFARYYYRIKDFQNEWIPLNRQNKIRIAFLPPGKHSVEIRAKFLNNDFQESAIKLPIQVYVYWFESKIFYFLFTTAIILFIFYFLYFRYKAKLEFSKVKIDLARDIHDEIGTLLTKSLLRIENLRYKEKKIADELKKIESGLREAIQSFRNVLWSINTDNQYAEDFVSRVQNILDDVFEDTSFEVTISNLSSDKFFNTSIRVKRNLLLIIKEVANNALKHSNGNLFELVINKEGNSWSFLLADNGTNSDEIHTLKNGIGLQSIESRVKSINGKLLIQKQSHGFFVKIKL